MNLSIPKVPIFNNRPAKIIDPGVGASTWASGNQVWRGTSGILVAKPKKKKIQSKNCELIGNFR